VPIRAVFQRAGGTVTAQAILEAMDGIALLIDRDVRIVACGWSNWQRFWRDNGGALPVPDPTGQCFLDFVMPGATRDEYRLLLEQVVNGARPAVRFDFRCDAPRIRRRMRVSMTRATLPETVAGEPQRGVLYQSVPIEEAPRPPQGLFATAAGLAEAPADPPRAVVTMCATCALVAWPPGAKGDAADWVTAPEYYRRGGGEDVLLAQAFCPDCSAAFLADES